MSREIKHLYSFGPFTLDEARGLLFRDGVLVQLTPKAFDTLLVLVRCKGDVVSKTELMSAVWPDSFVEETNLAQNISVVRKSLGENGEGHPYIETVPKRGYRFIAEVREIRDDAGPPAGLKPGPPDSTSAAVVAAPIRATGAVSQRLPAEGAPEPAPAALGGASMRSMRWLLIGVALVAAMAVILAVLFIRRQPRSTGAGKARTLAILPFVNDGKDRGPETDFLGFSMADTITTRLDYVGKLVVRPSAYVRKYRNWEDADPKSIAGELNANTLLVGSFSKDGDDLRIRAQLIDIEGNQILWRDEMNLKYDRMLTVQDRVAREIIGGLKLTLSPAEAERFKRDVPEDPRAYEYYLRGIDLYQANKFALAIEMLENSVKLDPNYAMAWAEVGTAYTARAAFGFGGREDYSRAQHAYEEALRLNPEQVEARIFLANLLTDTNRVEQAVPLLREAVAAAPNNALAHWELSYSYRFGGMLSESIVEGELARQLDPAVKMNSSAFNSYLYDGQYDRFLATMPAVEDSAFIMFYRGLGYFYLGYNNPADRSKAVAAFNRAYEIEPSLYARIGKALGQGMTGRSQNGLELLQKTEKMADERGVSEAEAIYKISQAYVELGDKPAALRTLGRSIENGFFCYPYFLRDPALQPLRADPVYKALIESARSRHEQFKARFF